MIWAQIFDGEKHLLWMCVWVVDTIKMIAHYVNAYLDLLKCALFTWESIKAFLKWLQFIAVHPSVSMLMLIQFCVLKGATKLAASGV